MKVIFTILLLLTTNCIYSQKYTLTEEINGFSTFEEILLQKGRYKHKIYDDQLCYSYWKVSFGNYRLNGNEIQFEKADSIQYSNNLVIYRVKNSYLINGGLINDDVKLLIRKNCELKNPLNIKYIDKDGIILSNVEKNVSNFEYPFSSTINSLVTDFRTYSFIQKNKKLIPNYKRFKPTGGESNLNFILNLQNP